MKVKIPKKRIKQTNPTVKSASRREPSDDIPPILNLPSLLGSDKSAGQPIFEVKKTKIKIIGLGGGGGNIVSEIASKIKKASFVVANTDYSALKAAAPDVTTFQFGEKFTHGLGTGMDPQVAEEAAKDERERIKKIMEGQDLVILVSSLGGGTGSGAVPIFAQISKSLGNLTYGIFTMPFVFEGAKKNEIAKNALERVKPYLNVLTILPNERVFKIVPKTTPFLKTLSYINKMLSDSLEGLIETIFEPGLINIDFADLRTILTGQGKLAFLNTVEIKKSGNSGMESFEMVFNSPMYPYDIEKAKGLLLNIVGEKDLKLSEVNQILNSVQGRIHRDAKIIFGVSQNAVSSKNFKVTILATGCNYRDERSGAVSADDSAVSGDDAGKRETAETTQKKKKKRPAAKKTKAAKANKKPEPEKKAKKESGKKGPDKKEAAPKKKEAPVKAEKKPLPAPAPVKEPEKAAAVREKDAPRPVPTQVNVNIEKSPAEPYAIRKNAIQVRKDIEKEEKEMLEKEKAWEIPAFLRKRLKNN